MSISYVVGACIEGEQLSLDCRKFLQKFPSKHSILNKLVYNFEMTKDARAVIHKEVSPKVAKIYPAALLNTGDGIHGGIISGFSIAPVKSSKIQHRTSAHRGQFLDTKAFSVAKLDRTWEALARALDASHQ